MVGIMVKDTWVGTFKNRADFTNNTEPQFKG